MEQETDNEEFYMEEDDFGFLPELEIEYGDELTEWADLYKEPKQELRHFKPDKLKGNRK
jgi:hypothetical protein